MFKGVHMHEENKLNLVRLTREKSEADLTDVVRFMKPADYATEESLTYFRTEENKMLFADWFHNQKLSNKILLPSQMYLPRVTR